MANPTSATIYPDLLAAWVQLTPQHQTLVLSLVQSLAAEDVVSGKPESETVDRMIVAAVLARLTSLPPPAPDTWQQTVGMFGDDPILHEITDEAAVGVGHPRIRSEYPNRDGLDSAPGR